MDDLIHVAAVITSAFEALQLDAPVVVGGLAVEIYTGGGYTTSDIDLIVDSIENIDLVMKALGFTSTAGYRYYSHVLFGDIVEFPKPPLDGSIERVVQVDFAEGKTCRVIGLEDIIMDRLREFVHWDNRNLQSSSATQLATLLKAHADKIDFHYLRQRASQEDLSTELDDLLRHSEAV